MRVSKTGEGGLLRIWDELRGIWLALSPEEWVRRHVIEYLIRDVTIPPAYIAQEFPVCVSGMPQRADIVVSDKNGKPFLLVECKAPDVVVNKAVYAQAVRYNAVVDAGHIMITNGLHHYIFEKRADGGYRQTDGIPDPDGYF